jgi:hypothetical protein
MYLPALHNTTALPTNVNQEKEQALQALSDSQSRLIAFKIISHDTSENHTAHSCLFDCKAWENLELYNGANLLNLINRSQLKLGEAALATLLCQPITDTDELERRKHILQTFISDEGLFSSLQAHFKKLGHLEHHFLGLWQEDNKFFKENFDRLYLSPSLYGSSVANKSTMLLELVRRGEDLATFLLLPFSLLYIRHLFKNGTYNQFSDHISNLKDVPSTNTLSETWLSLFFSGSELFFSLLNVPISLYQIMQYHHATWRALESIHTRLSHLAQTIQTARKIHKELLRHRSALFLYENQALYELFESKKQGTKNLKKLLALLEGGAFTKPFSYTSQYGKILVAYKLLEEVKDDLTPLLISLGRIDAYLSCTQLFKEFQTTNKPFCFAQYLDKKLPSISLTNFWNPLINEKSVVPNSLQLGYPLAQSIVLTGQNTGGKSTVLKGAALSILLAQTIGIVPAQHATLTPFDCLGTYMNITDNAKEGLSLFAAEVSHAKLILNTVSSLPPDKKAFVIIDEAFKGTGSEAEELSYWYAKQLSHHAHCMCINATHYTKLTSLEKETKGVCKNYKVEVTIDSAGNLIRPYKLEPGYTLHNIAEHILIEQGLKSPKN